MLSTVKLTFSGLLLLHVNDQATYCDVGIPRQVPRHHEPLMEVVVSTPVGSITPVSLGRPDFAGARYRLRVENCPQSNTITLLRDGPFSRLDDIGHEQDFRWVMDFESEIYPGKDIGHVEQGWLCWVRVGGGDFFTDKKSFDELLTYFEGSDELQRRGRVAVRIGAHINLDTISSRVVLEKRRGGATAWEHVYTCLPVPGVRYSIRLSQTMPGGMEPHPGERPHADFYYHAVGSKLSPREKQYFKSSSEDGLSHLGKAPRILVPEMRVDPRAICFTGQMSLTPSSVNLFDDASEEGQATAEHGHDDGLRGVSGGERG